MNTLYKSDIYQSYARNFSGSLFLPRKISMEDAAEAYRSEQGFFLTLHRVRSLSGPQETRQNENSREYKKQCTKRVSTTVYARAGISEKFLRNETSSVAYASAQAGVVKGPAEPNNRLEGCKPRLPIGGVLVASALVVPASSPSDP